MTEIWTRSNWKTPVLKPFVYCILRIFLKKIILTLTSMLTGADVRGWRYSGCSKWPPWAVNIFTIRMGSLLAWRHGSEGDGEDVGVGSDAPSAPLRWGSPLRSVNWLRKSASAPPGRSLIWIWAQTEPRAYTEWSPPRVLFLWTLHNDKFKKRERGNPERSCVKRLLRVEIKASYRRTNSQNVIL